MNITHQIRILILALIPLAAACMNRNTEQGNKASGENSDSQEIAVLRREIERYPDSIPLQISLVKELEKNKDWQKAIAEQEKIIQKDTLSSVSWYKMAQLKLASGDTAGGLNLLEKSIRINPEFTDPQLELGFLYADQKNQRALGVADYILKTAADPSSQTQARFLKGVYYSNINEKEKALQQFDSCMIYDYTFLDAYIEKGILLYDLKRFKEAIGVFDKALTISNTLAEGYYWKGKCYQAMNQKDEAIDFYRKAVGLDDHFEAAHNALKDLGAE